MTQKFGTGKGVSPGTFHTPPVSLHQCYTLILLPQSTTHNLMLLQPLEIRKFVGVTVIILMKVSLGTLVFAYPEFSGFLSQIEHLYALRGQTTTGI